VPRAVKSFFTQSGGRGTRVSTRAHLSKEVRSVAVRHVVVPKPTCVGSCDPKLQLTWQHVYTRLTSYLNLELVCEVPDLQCTEETTSTAFFSHFVVPVSPHAVIIPVLVNHSDVASLQQVEHILNR
jgi:hypothetical protein